MQVRILGPLEVWDGGGRAVELGAGRQRALLAMLTLHANEIVSTDRLIEELWRGSAPPTASKALQNLVSQLRRALGPEAIETVARGYRLRLGEDDLDARLFERRAAEGRAALETNPDRAAELLGDALALWRGAALADFAYEDFAQNEIARLEELRLGTIEDRVDGDLATGSAGELVPELEALVSANPLRERLRGQLMLALYRSGRQAEALDVYRTGRDALRAELGLEPGVALRDLEGAILNQDPTLGVPRKAPTAVATRRRPRLVAVVVAALVLVAGAVAWVARDDEAPATAPNSLVKIDVESNEIVDVVPVGRSPGEVAVAGEYAVVSSEQDATLTRIAVGSGETTTSGATGADLGLASAGNRFVWAVSLQQDRVSRVDVSRLQSIDGVPLAPDLALAFVAVGGGSLWVAQQGPSAVLRYGLGTLALERRYDLGIFEIPVEPAYGYGAAWVVLGASAALLRIDALTGRATTISAGSRPSGPAVGFGSVWSTSIDEGTLWRFDGVTGQGRTVADVGRAPFGVATGAGSVWVTNNCDGTVRRIHPETTEVIATIRTGFFPKWLAVGGDHVWVGITGEAWDPEICE